MSSEKKGSRNQGLFNGTTGRTQPSHARAAGREAQGCRPCPAQSCTRRRPREARNGVAPGSCWQSIAAAQLMIDSAARVPGVERLESGMPSSAARPANASRIRRSRAHAFAFLVGGERLQFIERANTGMGNLRLFSETDEATNISRSLDFSMVPTESRCPLTFRAADDFIRLTLRFSHEGAIGRRDSSQPVDAPSSAASAC